MFEFHFVYSDGNTYDVSDVNKILIQTASGNQEYCGDAILSARIPLKNI